MPFSVKRRQKARVGEAKGSAWRNARVAWGGLRRGKTDVQTPRTLALEDRLWKDSEGPRIESSARRPEMGGGPLRAFRRAILISIGFYERVCDIEANGSWICGRRICVWVLKCVCVC